MPYQQRWRKKRGWGEQERDWVELGWRFMHPHSKLLHVPMGLNLLLKGRMPHVSFLGENYP